MPSVITAPSGYRGVDSHHGPNSPNAASGFRKFHAQEKGGLLRSASKAEFDKGVQEKKPQAYKLRDFNVAERRSNNAADTLSGDKDWVKFRFAAGAAHAGLGGPDGAPSQALADGAASKRWGIADRSALFPPLFPPLFASNNARSLVSELPWQSDCLRSLGIPPPAPRDLADILEAVRPKTDLAPPMAAFLPPRDESAGQTPFTPDARRENKFHLAMSTFAQAFRRACDMVYTGVNAMGRGCRDACLYMYGLCVDRLHRAAHARGAVAGDAGGPAASRAPQGKGLAQGAGPGLGAKDLLERQLDTLRDAYNNTAAMEKFKDSRLTDQDLLYLIKPKGFRMARDAAGLGLDGPAGVSGALMRSLTTAADNVKDPFRAFIAFGTEGDRAKYMVLRDEYLSELAARHPDFEAMRLRLRNFGDNRGMAELEANIEAARRGLGTDNGRSIDIADMPLLRATMADPLNRDAAVIDPSSGAPETVGVTGRQLSADIAGMRKCLADMIAYLEALGSRM